MAIDYSLLLTLKSMFRDGKYGREHNKHDFDADYNNFVLMQDKLTILANYEQAHGGIDTLLSYLDDNVVGSAIKDACNDKRYLSKAIENAYLVEDLKAKLDGNKSFDDVARAVYEKFEGKITPAEFVGSSVYTGCFSGEHLSATLNDKISERDYEAGHFLDTDELDEDAIPDEVYNLADTYYIGDYELESYSRESHIDLSDYAEKLNQFVIDKGFGKYVGNTVKSRLRSVLDYSFHEELCQAGSRVYFNRSLSGGNLEHLHDFVNYLIDNKSSFDKIAVDHVVDEVMRDKLVDVAKDVSELSCDSILKNEERAKVVCGVAMEQFYRARVGKFAGTCVIQSFVDNDKIKEGGKSMFYGDLREYLSYQMREKIDENFGFYELKRAKSIDLGLVKNNNDTIYASCADAYATYKDITKGALSTIVNGFKNGLSYSDIRDSLKPYDDNMLKMFFGVRVGDGYVNNKEICINEAMDNRPLTEVYSNILNTCKQKGIKGPARTSYINKSLDVSIAYKSYMCGELTSSMMNNKDMMSNLAKDVNLLSSEYNVSFDKKHLVDLVSAFNDFDSDVKDFSDNLDIKAKFETKRKMLNVPFDIDADKQSTDDDDFDK